MVLLRTHAAALVAVVVSAVAVSCAVHRHPPSSGPTGPPVRGGTLTYSDVQFVTDTMAANYSANNLMFQVLDRVVYVEPKTDRVYGWLAQEFTRNSDATRYTFTIRNGVSFSDRTPLNAEVVKSNFDQLAKGDPTKKMPAFADFVGYDHSEVSGNVVTVFFNQPNANFYKVLSYSRSGIRSASTLALDYQHQSKIENVVGSGPFVYQSQIPDQQVVLKKRPDYSWPPASSPNQGAPYLDQVIFRVITEPGLRAGAVQSHQVDVARGIQPTDETALKQGGLQVLPVAAPAETANLVGFRINDQVVNDVRVRRALQWGIDRQAVVDTVLSDSYRASDSVLGHDDPLFADESTDIGYHPQQSADLLDAAGWKVGGDGVREKDGKKLNLTLAASNQSVVFRPAFEFIESEWRELGVALQNRAGDTTFFNASSTDAATPLFGTRIQYNIGLGLLFGRQRSNLTFAKNDELIALSREELKETDPVRLKDVVAREQHKIIEDQLALVLWDEIQVHAAAPNVHVEFTRYTEPLLQSAWKT
jgi:peptide/nickel transport system substrate-binding protein